ncbi:iron ABC transporter permease [Leucobacter sp. cx-328]|nr:MULTISPECIES: iron ABC transporter permease [unclassified Leucobacter]MBC9943298.1 iron ABC transporter permease [Leucobacter sp. cx-328]
MAEADQRNARPVTRNPWRAAGWAIAVAIPLAFLALFFLWPVVALIATGLVEDGRVSLAAFGDAAADPRTWRVLGNTLAQASSATAIALLLGLPAAYVLYRLEFRGRGLLRGFLTVPFVLPTVVVGIAFTSLFGPGGSLNWLGLDGSFLAIVLALVFFNITVVARTVGGFWSQLDTRSAEAARMLGASPARAFATITLPALAPAIASAAALVFLFCATSFGVVLILGGREFANIETEIYRLTVQFLDLRGAAVLSITQFVIIVLVLWVSARLKRAGSRSGEQSASIRRERAGARRARITDLPVILIFTATVLFVHLAPLLSLLLRSLRAPDGSWSFAGYVSLVKPHETSPLRGSVFDAMGLSIGIALIATAIAVLLGSLVALVLSRKPRAPGLKRAISLYDGAMMLPLGISAVTLGFGLLLTMHRPLGIGIDLRTSTVLIPIAQALVALPLVVRTILPVLNSIDQRTREAAMMLGATPMHVLRTIDVPLLGRSAGLAVGFAFAASLGEFGATSFLVRPDAQTLPVAIAALASHPDPASYASALAAAVVLGVVTATIMLLAERMRFDTVAAGGTGGEW